MPRHPWATRVLRPIRSVEPPSNVLSAPLRFSPLLPLAIGVAELCQAQLEVRFRPFRFQPNNSCEPPVPVCEPGVRPCEPPPQGCEPVVRPCEPVLRACELVVRPCEPILR